jgi:hypothetical protein
VRSIERDAAFVRIERSTAMKILTPSTAVLALAVATAAPAFAHETWGWGPAGPGFVIGTVYGSEASAVYGYYGPHYGAYTAHNYGWVYIPNPTGWFAQAGPPVIVYRPQIRYNRD